MAVSFKYGAEAFAMVGIAYGLIKWVGRNVRSLVSDSRVEEAHVEALDAERHARALLSAELVDQKRVLRALGVLEEKRRPAGLHHPVHDLGDLEVGVDLGRDAAQLARALEERDPLAEVSRRAWHGRVSLWTAVSC